MERALKCARRLFLSISKQSLTFSGCLNFWFYKFFFVGGGGGGRGGRDGAVRALCACFDCKSLLTCVNHLVLRVCGCYASIHCDDHDIGRNLSSREVQQAFCGMGPVHWMETVLALGLGLGMDSREHVICFNRLF